MVLLRVDLRRGVRSVCVEGARVQRLANPARQVLMKWAVHKTYHSAKVASSSRKL